MAFISSNEVLLNNIIEKDFQLILFPLEVLQWLVFQNKYVIRNNFISSKGLYNNVLCGCTVLLLLVIFIFDKVVKIINYCHFSSEYSFGCATNIIELVCFTPQMLLVYGSNVYLSNKSVELILKMQNIHKYVNTKCNSKYLKVQNWFWSVLTIIFFTVSVYSKIATNMSLRAMTVAVIHNYMQIDVLLSITYMAFLTTKLGLLNNSLKRDRFTKIYQCYSDVLAAYRLYKKHFEIIILVQVVNTFLQQLLAVQSFIEIFAKSTNNNILTRDSELFRESTRLKFILVCRNLLLHCVIDTKCQQFYNGMEEARAACCKHMCSDSCPVETRRHVKNIVRMQSVSFGPVCAASMFAANARLPLGLLSALATYTFVLLQFAYNRMFHKQ